MKKIILIGDSIRLGYEQGVIDILAGRAAVSGPSANGGDSRNVLKNIDEWLAERADIIHLNCGLHDLKRSFNEPNAVPLDEYAANLALIFQRLKAMSGAKIIWAATTPVNEKLHHEVKGFDRLENDVDAYNQAASNAAQQAGVPINNLFDVVMKAGRDRLLTDGVHFNPEGRVLLSKAVADFIIAGFL